MGLEETKKRSRTFGGTSLSEGRLSILCRRIEPNVKPCRLIELGGGSSTNLTDEEWAALFARPELAPAMWEAYGKPVPEEHHRHYTIHNAFYSQADSLPLDKTSVAFTRG